MSDEKFLKLRGGIWEHLSPDGLLPTEFLVFVRILSLTNIKTGELRITVAHLAAELNGTLLPNSVKKTLLALERKGYIHRRLERLTTGMWVITPDKFEIPVGSKAGQRTGIPKPEGVITVTPDSSEGTQGVITVTTYPDSPCCKSLPTRVGSDVNHDSPQFHEFSGNGFNELTPLRCREEGEGDSERTQPASLTSDTETERRTAVRTEPDKRQRHNPAQPKGKALGTVTVPLGPQGKKPARSAVSVPPTVAAISSLDGKPIPSWMPLSHPLRNTDADFDALDWAFSLTDSVNGMESDEIRRAVYWHWNHDPKKYWRNQNIPTIARFTAALPKMLADVPKKFRQKVTGGKIPYTNPACEICKGTGIAAIIPNPAYAEDSQFTAAIGCSCKTLHPYPFRIERTEIK